MGQFHCRYLPIIVFLANAPRLWASQVRADDWTELRSAIESAGGDYTAIPLCQTFQVWTTLPPKIGEWKELAQGWSAVLGFFLSMSGSEDRGRCQLSESWAEAVVWFENCGSMPTFGETGQ